MSYRTAISLLARFRGKEEERKRLFKTYIGDNDPAECQKAQQAIKKERLRIENVRERIEEERRRGGPQAGANLPEGVGEPTKTTGVESVATDAPPLPNVSAVVRESAKKRDVDVAVTGGPRARTVLLRNWKRESIGRKSPFEE
jgi:hypothetical protein